MEQLLITGGAGYIGSHIVQYLVREKNISPESIIIFDNTTQNYHEVLPDEIRYINGDLRNFDEIQAVFGENEITSVLHLAGILNVAESMQKPNDYFLNNVTGGHNLLRAMTESKCRMIVFSSSCTVYGNAKSPVTEDTLCEPANPYGESKLQFERMLAWYSKIHQFKAISLRYFNAAGAAYGIGESHVPEIHIIPSVLQAALNQKDVMIFGNDYDTPDGTCVRDYIHVRDLADAHVRALEKLAKGVPSFEVFNLGSGRGVSVHEIVSISRHVTQKPISVKYGQRRAGDAAIMVANAEKAANELGWKPKHTIEESIQDAWNWLISREN